MTTDAAQPPAAATAAGHFQHRGSSTAGAATLLRAGQFEVPYGWRLPLRITEFHVAFVGIRGRLHFAVGGADHELAPGTVLWLPRHRAHQAAAPYRESSLVYVLHFSLPTQEHPALPATGPRSFTGHSAESVRARCDRMVSHLADGTGGTELRADAELNLLLGDLLDDPGDTGTGHSHGLTGRSADIARVLDHIASHTDAPLRVTELADLAGLHRGHFTALFTRLTGLNPSRYVTAARIARARELLDHSNLTLDTIAQRCGFSSASHLARRFKEYEGMAPGSYRDSQRLEPSLPSFVPSVPRGPSAT